MSQTMIFGFGALFLAMLMLNMHRMGVGAGARLWGAAFLCMYASGILLAISQRFVVGRVLYPMVGTAWRVHRSRWLSAQCAASVEAMLDALRVRAGCLER